MTNTETVNRFYELSSGGTENLDNRLAEIEGLLSGDFVFTGPAMKVEGAKEYVQVLEKFIPIHDSFDVLKQFESGDDVCSITELIVNSPGGEKVKMDVAEWMKMENGKIKEHIIYYDPRDFLEAFPMNN